MFWILVLGLLLVSHMTMDKEHPPLSKQLE